MRKAVWFCGLALCLAMIVGCGGGTEGPEPPATMQDMEKLVDLSAASEILELTGVFPLDPKTMEVRCDVLREAAIVVEYPSAEGTKTLEVQATPPRIAIVVPGFSAEGGEKIAIRPKERGISTAPDGR